jgi:group I intron endonuclease
MVIYKTTNLINGKQYIGKDKNNDPNYIGSGSNLKEAIKTYGKSAFKKEILEYCNNTHHLAEREEYWLNYYNAESNSDFYNKTNKAFGNSGMSEENKANIKQGLKNRKWNPEWGELSGKARQGIKHKKHASGEEHGNYNKPKSKKHKENMSIARKGTKLTEEWKQAIKNNRQKCINVKSKPIIQLDENNNIINEYKSMTDARNTTSIKGIKNVVTGLAKTAGGFIWKYKED